jgi:hypothetical protein
MGFRFVGGRPMLKPAFGGPAPPLYGQLNEAEIDAESIFSEIRPARTTRSYRMPHAGSIRHDARNARVQEASTLPGPASRVPVGCGTSCLHFLRALHLERISSYLRTMKRTMEKPRLVALLAAWSLMPHVLAQDTDHQGRDWAPVGEVYGRHYNIGTCTINQEIFVRPPVNGDENQGGKLQIEANFITVPYNMPSPWDDWQR